MNQYGASLVGALCIEALDTCHPQCFSLNLFRILNPQVEYLFLVRGISTAVFIMESALVKGLQFNSGLVGR